MPIHALSKAQADFFRAGLTAEPPQRHDGRPLLAFRPIEVEADIAAQANGSSSITLGGTEVVCGVKCEVRTFGDDQEDDEAEDLTLEDDESDDEDDEDGVPFSRKGGKIKCSVECSPSVLHTFDSRHLETVTASLSSTIAAVFSPRSSPIPLSQLLIIPRSKHWTLYVDVLVTSLAGGNLFDAVFAAIFAALYDTRVPKTRGVAFEAPSTASTTAPDGSTLGAFENAKGDLDQMGIKGLLKSKKESAQAREGDAASKNKVVDFELENQQDEGFRLSGREEMPLCITVNVLPKTYLLDATVDEEACIASRIHVVASRRGRIHAVKVEGTEEVSFQRVSEAIKIGAKQAALLANALQAKLDADARSDAGDDDDDVVGAAGDGMELDQ